MKLEEVYNAVPDYLSLMHEDHAIDYGTVDFPDFNPRYSKVVGTMDSRDVWVSRYYPNHHTFAFVDGEHHPLAFVVIKDNQVQNAHPLTRVWSTSTRDTIGMVAALVSFMLRKLQLKLIITSDEPLTPSGWNFLIKSIERNKFSARDAKTGDSLTSQQLMINRDKQVSTQLAVILESDRPLRPLFGTGYRQLSEMVLMIGDPSLE